MDNINNINNMIRSLNNLKTAFKEVNNAWSECSYMDELKDSVYPFESSFDELTFEVEKWVESSIDELKKNNY